MSTMPRPVWAGRDMRLDPLRLPQTACYASRDDHGAVTITIDRRGAVIRRQLDRAGMPASIVVPARAFAGVAARAVTGDDGETIVTLELHHEDPALTVPLLVGRDLYEIAADWRQWSECFGLPMLLIEADGVARTLEESARRAVSRHEGRRAAEQRRPGLGIRSRAASLGLRLVIGGKTITRSR